LFVKTFISETFNISHNCKEKDLEMCGVELETRSLKLITLTSTERRQEILINL